MRTALLFLFLLVLVRLIGKKEIGNPTPMEFLSVLLLARAVGPAMTAGDNSISVAVVAAVTLVGLTALLNQVVFRSRRAERWIEGSPRLLIEKGRIDEEALRLEKITLQQLISGLRAENVEDPERVEKAYLEPSGKITVVKRQ